MSRNLMVLFLLVAVICATAISGLPPDDDCKITIPPPTHKPTTKKPLPPPKCPKNEIWSECGAGCQPSCKNPKPICPAICIKGCVCKPGLLRNKKGKCVEPCDC